MSERWEGSLDVDRRGPLASGDERDAALAGRGRSIFNLARSRHTLTMRQVGLAIGQGA